MLNQLTIAELTAQLARREVSSRAALQACLDRIGQVDGRLRASAECGAGLRARCELGEFRHRTVAG